MQGRGRAVTLLRLLPSEQYHDPRTQVGYLMHGLDNQFFLRWIYRVVAWFRRAYLALFTLLFLASISLVSLFYYQTEFSVRLSGLSLQLVGIAFAAIGIRDTRRMFGKPSFLAQVRVWFNAIPIPRRRATTISTSGSGSSSVSSTVTVQEWQRPGDTFESRLSAVEKICRSAHSCKQRQVGIRCRCASVDAAHSQRSRQTGRGGPAVASENRGCIYRWPSFGSSRRGLVSVRGHHEQCAK